MLLLQESDNLLSFCYKNQGMEQKSAVNFNLILEIAMNTLIKKSKNLS